jgi:hypothetical protein
MTSLPVWGTGIKDLDKVDVVVRKRVSIGIASHNTRRKRYILGVGDNGEGRGEKEGVAKRSHVGQVKLLSELRLAVYQI